ncbi:MAG: acyl-CoA dehydrogenase family protein [Proteobacteria bacterium]|nr:acyl-CoA dehydrogenase family protein [Pseudomonadota bacterium]
MEFGFSREQLDFRTEAEDFVRGELPPDWDQKAIWWPGGYGTIPEMETAFEDFSRAFLKKLGAKGWLGLSWPEEHGGQASMIKQAILGDVLSYYRAPAGGVAVSIAAPTIILAGDQELKREFLPRIAAGEAGFWLGYSEPNAGSDLAALKTSAVADGDEYVINGQKIWSSGAHVTEYAWLMAKTDFDAPRHKSATLMIVPNDAPGLTIRPIINICGFHSFNEVFFDEVRIPKKYVVGQVNRGFYNVMLALQFERLAVGVGAFRRVLEELVQFARETEVGGEPLSGKPDVRAKLARMAIELEVFYTLYWQTAFMLETGRVPEQEASALKLMGTELGVLFAQSAVDVLGPFGLLDTASKWAPMAGRIALGYLDSISGPIGAGTSEIQRTIIATRGLGLPRGE